VKVVEMREQPSTEAMKEGVQRLLEAVDLWQQISKEVLKQAQGVMTGQLRPPVHCEDLLRRAQEARELMDAALQDLRFLFESKPVFTLEEAAAWRKLGGDFRKFWLLRWKILLGVLVGAMGAGLVLFGFASGWFRISLLG
jgi:hypothetical protein